MRQIKRDPFACYTLVREVGEHGECKECGQPAKYYYRWEADSVHERNKHPYSKHDGPFCSIGCYHKHTT